MDFEILRDLVTAVTKNKLAKVDVLDNPGKEHKSREEELYEGISTGKFKDDDEAAAHFFGTNAVDQKYKKLKNRLIRQLVNVSFFLDTQTPLFNDYANAFVNCHRDYAAALLLYGRYSNRAGLYLFHQVLEQTMKYQLTDLTVNVLQLIRTAYGRMSGDRATREKYGKLLAEYKFKQHWESQATSYMENIIDYYTVKMSPSEEIHQTASAYYDELLEKVDEVDTLTFRITTGVIGIIKYMAINDYVTPIKIVDEILGIWNNKQVVNSGRILSLLFQKLVCKLQLRELDDAAWHETMSLAESILTDDRPNYSRLMALRFSHAMYSRQYDAALEMFINLQKTKMLASFKGKFIEDWYLYEAYLNLLAVIGIVDPARLDANEKNNFRLNKLMNEFEVLDKDKEGMNIPVLFLPLLFSLAEGDTSKNPKSDETLIKYRQRYLSNDLNQRSAAFLKLLLALEKYPFEEEASVRMMQKEYKNLLAVPPEINPQHTLIEVVPYEDLWDMLFEKVAGKKWEWADKDA